MFKILKKDRTFTRKLGVQGVNVYSDEGLKELFHYAGFEFHFKKGDYLHIGDQLTYCVDYDMFRSDNEDDNIVSVLEVLSFKSKDNVLEMTLKELESMSSPEYNFNKLYLK
jgi:hypothetical protein